MLGDHVTPRLCMDFDLSGLQCRFGPVVIGEGYVEGPNGLKMRYQVTSTDKNDLRYIYGKRSYHMYGGKFLENIVQFLARIVVMNAAAPCVYGTVDISSSCNRTMNLCFIAFPEGCGRTGSCHKAGDQRGNAVRRPSWARDLPLKAEVGSGQTYGDAGK